MTIRIELPVSDELAKACVLAAESFGVEPWEMAAYALTIGPYLRGDEKAQRWYRKQNRAAA